MTRSMGDAISMNAAAVVAANPDVIAVYVTGGGIIQWTAADLALIPAGKPVVTIDQGFTGSPVAWATVRDVEAGAWSMTAAVNRSGWTAPRPTIYLSESLLLTRVAKLLRFPRLALKTRVAHIEARMKSLATSGWQGDVWVALYDGIPDINFAVPAGMNCVAKQYTDLGGGGAYDLSAVFDPTWPALAPDPPPKEEDSMIIWAVDGNAYLLSGGRMHKILDTAMIQYFQSAGVPVVGSQNNIVIDAAEEAAMLADFPPGSPAITIPPVNVTFPKFAVAETSTATITPA